MKEIYDVVYGIFPLSSYLYINSQQNGIFGLVFKKHEVTADYHQFSNNQFYYNFCNYGCAYFLEGEKAQQIYFYNNSYAYMIAQGATVYTGYYFALSRSKAPFFQMFNSERFENIVGGTLYFKNLNTGGLTILEKCRFYNNFGDEGASIALD